ncbi:YkgB family protein [Pseudomonas japonica]|uniref:YkgB family protein n=1 Tax=Pseudomonas japonica TaxID=256466 RepID=UPI0038159E7F
MNRILDSQADIALLRWALVLIFALFGYAKWFDYEAQALIPLLDNSPLLFWMHGLFGIQGASYALGVAEWSIGLGLALGAWWPRIGAAAAAASALTYLVTLTLVFSTPGAWEASAGGFPAMGGATSFLIKDLVLLAASVTLLKHALRANGARSL